MVQTMTIMVHDIKSKQSIFTPDILRIMLDAGHTKMKRAPSLLSVLHRGGGLGIDTLINKYNRVLQIL